MQMTYLREKKFSSAPYAKIFIAAYYIILPIYVESFSWQYMAALCGSYIVDIVSRAPLLRGFRDCHFLYLLVCFCDGLSRDCCREWSLWAW